MGGNSRCSWDDGKRERNLANHGYDFADLEDAFDGRFCLTRRDARKDYGEERYTGSWNSKAACSTSRSRREPADFT